MSTAAAIVLLGGILAYALFGGADFGAGFWELMAGEGEGAERPRRVIEHSIGPVWEANHVWLIFIFVVLWTAFSEAYASIMLTLFVPLTLAALGVVLRGASFAFRKTVDTARERRLLGLAFALSSLLVPFFLGAVAGGVASGRVPAGGKAGDPVDSWLNPTSILGGVLAVAAVAYLAAVYLVWDARRLDDAEMAGYFRVRAIGAGIAVAVIGVVGVFVLRSDAPYLYDGLTSEALPLVVVSAVCGVGALALLLRDASHWARLLAVLAVAGVVAAWGVAQWPYVLPESLTFADAAAPSGTLTTLFIVIGLALVIVIPAFALLYVLDQKGLLPEEGVADIGDPSTPLRRTKESPS
ncbi:cytochrome d ubiquinol oxidase subunit II [Angustibacter sp. McL0619]|uniref:cytochrome d ubiquinol oxidase subunit II n=1 Tax=Angustibacter sp. McL0619 TaxID=3415676 RepID=UPI003CECE80A